MVLVLAGLVASGLYLWLGFPWCKVGVEDSHRRGKTITRTPDVSMTLYWRGICGRCYKLGATEFAKMAVPATMLTTYECSACGAAFRRIEPETADEFRARLAAMPEEPEETATKGGTS